MIIFILLFLFSSNVMAQELTYEAKDGRLKEVLVNTDERTYSVDEIKKQINQIEDYANQNISVIQNQKVVNEKVWQDRLKQAVNVGLISDKDLNYIQHELRGEVEGINWTDLKNP